MGAKNSNILNLNVMGYNAVKTAKFCFLWVHKVALPSACFGSLVIFHRFHLLSSLPPSHSVPLCPQPTLEVSLLLISFLKACGHTATYPYPIMKPVYLCIYPQFSFDEGTLSKRISTLLVLVIDYMCTRTDTI